LSDSDSDDEQDQQLAASLATNLYIAIKAKNSDIFKTQALLNSLEDASTALHEDPVDLLVQAFSKALTLDVNLTLDNFDVIIPTLNLSSSQIDNLRRILLNFPETFIPTEQAPKEYKQPRRRQKIYIQPLESVKSSLYGKIWQQLPQNYQYQKLDQLVPPGVDYDTKQILLSEKILGILIGGNDSTNLRALDANDQSLNREINIIIDLILLPGSNISITTELAQRNCFLNNT